MTTTLLSQEQRRIREVAEGYRRRGYRVVVEPDPQSLPDFLTGFRPDILAESPEEEVIVEVKPTGAVSPDYWQRLSETVLQHPGWRLELVVTDPLESGPRELLGEDEIRDSLDEAATQARAARRAAASFLLAWAATEGAMRLTAAKHNLELPDQNPGTLITRLYTDGLMEREDYDQLLLAQAQRNAVAHGFRREVTPEDVERLRSIAERILAE